MLIVENSNGSRVEIINSGEHNANNTPPNKNNDVDLFKLLGNANFPVGTIMLYNGKLSDIKAPWFICDGKNDTPNLENQFTRCIKNPNESDQGNKGGSSHSNLPDHTHTAKITPTGKHIHKFPELHWNTEEGGEHSHTQYHSPRRGGRMVCSACGPTSGSHKIHYGVFEDGDPSHLTTESGYHKHIISIKDTDTDPSGKHNHDDIILDVVAGTGKGENIPEHIKMFHIMKVR